MTYKMHLLTTLTAGVIMIDYLGAKILPHHLVLLAFGALLPDIDEPESYIGQRLKPISKTISIFFKHRTITHNILIYIALIVWLFQARFAFAFELYLMCFGAIFHILGDMCTYSGVAIYPSKKRLFTLPKILRFQVFSTKEYVVSLGMVIVALGLYWLDFWVSVFGYLKSII